MIRLAPLAVALTALSSACSGGHAKPVAATTTSTTAPSASVQQVASVVAEQDTPIRANLRAPEDCYIQWTDLCAADLTALKLNASTLSITLGAIDKKKPGNQLYVGSLPTELKPLVARTTTVLSDLATAFSSFDTACLPDGAGSQVCTEALFDVQGNADKLAHVLDAWRPYIGAPAEQDRG